MNKTPLDILSSTPKLLTDALSGVLPFESGFPVKVDSKSWIEFSNVIEKSGTTRTAVADLLEIQANKFDASNEVLNSITALKTPSTLAVVTGQQPGLMGGPLLTLYKTITTIYLAQKLEKESGVRTVPVFWMASSDHNLSEVTQLHWIDKKGQVTGFKPPNSENRVPVGRLKLASYSEEVIAALDSDMPDTEFKADLMEYLKSCYTSDATFSTAFQNLAYKLFGKYGLIILDPEDHKLKELTSPFWQHTIDNIDTLQENLIQQSQAISSHGYKLQVPVEKGRPSMFLIEDETRRKIVLDGYKIRAKSDIILSKDQLKKYAEHSPERLSAGVTLRPLLQSFFLPTGAYVAGPHEMAYWLQLNSSFKIFDFPRPAIVPRASFTLVEKKLRRRMNKYGIEDTDILKGENFLTEQFLSRNSDSEIEDVFAELRDYINSKEITLSHKCSQQLYKGMESKVDVGFRKMFYQVDKLESGFLNRLKNSHSDMLLDVEKLTSHLLPAGKPQERVVSPFYYLIRYGSGIIDGLIDHTGEAIGHHLFLDMEELI